jgi:hypothetical protein
MTLRASINASVLPPVERIHSCARLLTCLFNTIFTKSGGVMRFCRWAYVASLVVAGALSGCKGGAGDEGPAPAAILLFAGTGTSPHDVEALEAVLKAERLSYVKVDSAQMNAIREAKLRGYRLLIVPGGNFEQIGNALTPEASARIRDAVYNGMNYLGICAGAFFAGNSPYNGLNLTRGVRFPFYSAEFRGIRKAAVSVTGAGGQTLDQYWEDGPQLSGWGMPVAKYPDGTPAVVEGWYESGWVVLSGVHPEAPEDWRAGMRFITPASVDNAYAGKLANSALNRESMKGRE